ncbi:Putative sugar O-methyltransferase [Candidatus Nanopelagicaceae bacterium]
MATIKNLLLALTPPIARSSYLKIKNRNTYKAFSVEYWNTSELKLPAECEVLIENFVDSEDLLHTSKYWLHLLRLNLEELHISGLENYGKEIARHYFTWTDFDDSKIKNLEYEDSNQYEHLEVLKVHPGFSRAESLKHNLLIQILLNFLLSKNLAHEVKQLEDGGYLFGGHPYLESNYGNVTLDKLSSILEYQNYKSGISNCVLEVGAGSGRTAEIVLRLNPNVKYVIADIPPASFISYSRIKNSFPDRNLRIISSKEELIQLLSSGAEWDVLMVLPSVLEHFPDKFFDLMLAIDCLHEMSDFMRNYFAEIAENKSSNYYFKIWNETRIPLDNVVLSSTRLDQFGVKKNWKLQVSQEAIFPGDFSEFLFQIGMK